MVAKNRQAEVISRKPYKIRGVRICASSTPSTTGLPRVGSSRPLPQRPRRRREAGRKVLERHRRREQKSLDEKNVALRQARQLRIRLDAFRDDVDVELSREKRDRLDDRLRLRRIGDLLDEGAIDLQLLDGETIKIVERAES